MDYLTEKSLGPILKSIYPNSEIFSQKKMHGKTWDYAIIINDKDKKHIPESMAIFDFLDRENDMKFMIFIEFDGHHHYELGSQVARDGNDIGCEWKIIDDDNEFVHGRLRIPYWIQLDNDMCKFLFNIDADFSGGFPQGFISEKVHLPERFCVGGDMRFRKELSILPLSVSKRVVDSLIAKSGYNKKVTVNKMSKCGTIELWDYMLRNFHPLGRTLKQMEEISPDTFNFYKHFDPTLYTIYYTDTLLRSVYKKVYCNSNSQESIQESKIAYCGWHGISIKKFDKMSKVEFAKA